MPPSGLESYGADRQWVIPTIRTSSSLALTTQDGNRSGPIGDETMMMIQHCHPLRFSKSMSFQSSEATNEEVPARIVRYSVVYTVAQMTSRSYQDLPVAYWTRHQGLDAREHALPNGQTVATSIWTDMFPPQ